MTRTSEPITDNAPLVTFAAERGAERLALIRSIRREPTGLGPRAFRRLILLLERLASESFSDGTETVARVAVLATALGCDRSTVFRSLADARRLGILATEQRFGTVDQQISSVRRINWSVIRLLADRTTATPKPSPATTATPPSQLRRPRRNCDPPVATATPNNPESPDNPETNKRSGIPDQKNTPKTTHPDRPPRAITADSIVDRVRIAYDRLGYRGGDGWILWSAIAAIDAGILAPGDVGRTLEACKAAGGGKGPGYFRRVLADKSGHSGPALTAALRRVAIVWGDHTPGQYPPHATTGNVTVQRPPSADPNRRDQILRQLEAIQ